MADRKREMGDRSSLEEEEEEGCGHTVASVASKTDHRSVCEGDCIAALSSFKNSSVGKAFSRCASTVGTDHTME